MDKLTIEEVEHLLNTVCKNGIKGMPIIRRIFEQMADTMRANEKLRALMGRIVAGEFDANAQDRNIVSGLLRGISNKESDNG